MLNFLDSEAVDDESPAEADDTPDDVPAEAPEEAPAETDDTPASAPDAAPEEEAPEEDTESPAPASPKDDNVIDVVGVRKPHPIGPPTAQDLDNEDALFAQDMQRGHIKPETYSSLFAKKDTLGKIGTLFGLLVSGMGSGLTGQPNAVLQMMDNQIKNDLEAQKLSNDNAQNWLRLSQAHKRQRVENAYTQAQTGKVLSEIGRTEAETRRASAGADLEATNAAMTKMRIAASGQIEDMINKMPEGPAKQNMIDVYQNQFLPSIIGANRTDNAQTSAKVGALHAINEAQQKKPGATAAPRDYPKVDTKKILALSLKARRAESAGVAAPAGTIPSAMLPAVMKEASDVNKNRAIYDTISRTFEDLDKQAAGGQLDKMSYDAIHTHIVGNLEKVVTRDEAEKLAGTMMPSASDLVSPKARQTKATQMWEQFKNNEAGATTLDGFGLLPPFPGPPKVSAGKSKSKDNSAPKKTSGGASDGTVQNRGGVDYVKVKGGWKKK